MYILINVYTCDNRTPYIASVEEYETYQDAFCAMNANANKRYEEWLETWTNVDGNESTKPRIERGLSTIDIVGYDYHDYWQIKFV
jgi:hypothetical protein